MNTRCGTVAILLLPIALTLSVGPSVHGADGPPHDRPAYDYAWGPDGLEISFRGLDPAVLDRLAEREMSREQWASLCAVQAYFGEGEVPRDLPALIGSYEVRGDVLAFRPKYPLARQDSPLRLRCSLDVSLWKVPPRLPRESLDPDLPRRVRLDIDLRPDSSRRPPPPTLDRIYPSREVLPENLLKFYLHFSTPMSRGEAYKHIRLLDASGNVVADPFLELDEELWSTDGTRFTLLFDPGRIKRGLKPREELGPVLEQGKSYTLVVARDWPSAVSVPLSRSVRRTFRVGPPDETIPDPATWTIHPPAADTRDRLAIEFPEPLDHALARRLIAVRDPGGHLVGGDVAIESGETVWSMRPGEGSWKPGRYRIEIGTELEDLAGNSIARPFEVDLVEPISARVKSATVSLPFRIGAGAGR
ncbi:unnamed protein product [uncultured bacterium]|nr:unnamed protein product [uncultured bacterium]